MISFIILKDKYVDTRPLFGCGSVDITTKVDGNMVANPLNKSAEVYGNQCRLAPLFQIKKDSSISKRLTHFINGEN